MLCRPSLKSSTMITVCQGKSNIEVHDELRYRGADIHQGKRSAYAAIRT